MNHTVAIVFSLSIFLAGALALFRFSKAEERFYPFFYFLWLGCLNEAVSLALEQLGRQTIVNNNIYMLGEALLLVRFFKRMSVVRLRPVFFTGLMVWFAVFWAIETGGMHAHKTLSVYFSITYSLAVVLLSIHTVNYLLTADAVYLPKNALLWICIGFIVYFTFRVLIYSFWLYGLTKSPSFLLAVSRILDYINLISNLIYALAVLWIPKKQPSLLLS